MPAKKPHTRQTHEACVDQQSLSGHSIAPLLPPLHMKRRSSNSPSQAQQSGSTSVAISCSTRSPNTLQSPQTYTWKQHLKNATHTALSPNQKLAMSSSQVTLMCVSNISISMSNSPLYVLPGLTNHRSSSSCSQAQHSRSGPAVPSSATRSPTPHNHNPKPGTTTDRRNTRHLNQPEPAKVFKISQFIYSRVSAECPFPY
jgi:hypothetical protein